jgi:hypothetical protein
MKVKVDGIQMLPTKLILAEIWKKRISILLCDSVVFDRAIENDFYR